MSTTHFPITVVVLIAILVANSRAVAFEFELYQRIADRVPKIVLEDAEQHRVRYLGVLRFEYLENGRRRTDGIPLTDELYRHLESAIRDELRRNDERRMVVVPEASRFAATIPQADHATPDKRRLLFSRAYPLEGNRRVPIDALITGKVEPNDQWTKFKVEILAVFRARPRELHILDRFEAPCEGLLHAVGASYYHKRSALPGQYSGNPLTLGHQDIELLSPHRPMPLVSFRIEYDGRPVTATERDHHHEFWVPEPTTGQRVSLILERIDPSDRKLGAVVKVNGVNVLGRERLPDVHCRKYFLDPNQSVTIRGFQDDQNGGSQFVIASPEEASELESIYGPDVNSISLTIYREVEEGDDLQASDGGYQERGPIKPGKRIYQPTIHRQRAEWHPVPLMSVVYRYYHPQGR